MSWLHRDTFEYLTPTDEQKKAMSRVRTATRVYCDALEADVPNGIDKTYVMRKLREVLMWANVAITRYENGEPRE